MGLGRRDGTCCCGNARVWHHRHVSVWTEVDKPDRIPRKGRDLAEFVVGLGVEDLPEDVVHQAKRVLLEAISWPFLGSRRPEGRRLHDFLDGLPAGECSVAGRSGRLSPGWAAFANGALSQVEDCNDGQRVASVYGGAFHPGRVVVPVALAAGQGTRRSGKELLTAIVAGYEVAARVRGLEPRPPAAAYAGAAVSARLHGLDPNAALTAIGIVGHLASPIPDETPYDVTFLTVGNLARLSLEATELARRGMTGPPLQDDARFSQRLAGEGLGETFHITEIYMKPYLGCRLAHGAVEGGLELRDDLDWRQIDRISVRVIPEAHYVCGHAPPDSYYRTAQLSLAYCLAATLIDGELGDEQFSRERIRSEDVQALQHRIEVVTDESLDAGYPHAGRPTVMEVTTGDGRIHRRESRFDVGEPENPLGDDRLVEKFHRWAGPSLGPGSADRLVAAVMTLDTTDDPGELFELLRSAPP